MKIIIPFLTLLLWLPVLCSSMETVTVSGVGFIVGGDIAVARDQAILDAQARAVEQVVGVEIDAKTVLHKALLIDSTLLARSAGIVKSYNILEEGLVEHELYRVMIEAVVDSELMRDEIAVAAGQKNILLVTEQQEVEIGDLAVVEKLSDTLSEAGFMLQTSALPLAQFAILTSKSAVVLAQSKKSDMVMLIKLRSSVVDCQVDNFCAALATGFIKLYGVNSGKKLAEEKIAQIRGFGNNKVLAQNDATAKGSAKLVSGLISQIFQMGEQDIKISVKNIPDFAEYKSLKRTIESLRWISVLRADTVGYHPGRSVFLAKFSQELDILGGVLGKLGKYKFQGRTDNVYSLEYDY